MRPDIRAWRFLALTAVLAAMIALEVLRDVDGVQRLNDVVLSAVPYIRDVFVEALTDSASLEVFAVLAVVLYFIDAATRGSVSARTASFIVALLASMIVTALLKAYVAVPRPLERPAYFGLLGNLLNADYFSFPSGHTVRVTVLSYYSAAYFRRTRAWWAPYVVYTYAGAIMITRLLLRVHWAFDIIGGIVVGLWSSELVEGPGRPLWVKLYNMTLGRVGPLRLRP